jgi:hypothetical protein
MAKSSRAGLPAIFAATTSLMFAPILSTLRLRLRVRPWLTRVYQAMTKKKIWSGKSKFLKAIAQRKIPVDARSLEMRGARGNHQPRRQLFELLPGLQEAKGATTISLPKAEKEGRS